MGETTAIQWTGATWNPWQGCHKVSEKCRFCYMYREKKRYGQDPNVVVRSKPPTFNLPLKLEPTFVFVCSWSDFFIREADPWRAEAWDIIRRRRDLVFQIPTARPERIRECLPPDWGAGWPNVWLLASIEDQPNANARVYHLLGVPAVVHGVSCEPLLGAIDLTRVEAPGCGGFQLNALTGRLVTPDHQDVRLPGMPTFNRLGWVIAGGESGPFARPMHPDHARRLRDQATAHGVPFFFKQWGEWKPAPNRMCAYRRRDEAGKVVEWEVTASTRSRDVGRVNTVAIPFDANDNAGNVELLERVGKKAAGAELDGKRWEQMPEVTDVR